MTSFEEGYDFFAEHAGGFSGAYSGSKYVSQVDFELDEFVADEFTIDEFDVEEFRTETFEITPLRRGVIGVSKIGYIHN